MQSNKKSFANHFSEELTSGQVRTRKTRVQYSWDLTYRYSHNNLCRTLQLWVDSVDSVDCCLSNMHSLDSGQWYIEKCEWCPADISGVHFQQCPNIRQNVWRDAVDEQWLLPLQGSIIISWVCWFVCYTQVWFLRMYKSDFWHTCSASVPNFTANFWEVTVKVQGQNWHNVLKI